MPAHRHRPPLGQLRLRPRALLCGLTLCLPALAVSTTPAPTGEHIYRCTGTDGRIRLQDRPCNASQRRTRSSPSTTTRTLPLPLPENGHATPDVVTRTIVLEHSKPLYRCVTPQGTGYLTDDSQGHPRRESVPVAVWVDSGLHIQRPPSVSSRPPAPEPPNRPSATGIWASIDSQPLVRDSCQRLITEDACHALSEAREQLIDQYSNALTGDHQTQQQRQHWIEHRMEQYQCP